MDRLDRISIWAIVLLIISSFVLAGDDRGEAGLDRKAQQKAAAYVSDDALNQKIKLAKNLMESNNLDKAEMLVKELVEKYPYDGAPHMVRGDIFFRRQNLLKAMPEYKKGIDLNPDYLDKRTPLFQGKKLKVAVNEALAKVDRNIKEDPDNKEMKKKRKLIYYLKRRIAGSCG